MQANAKPSRIPQPTYSRIPRFQPLPCPVNTAKQLKPTSRTTLTAAIASTKISSIAKNSLVSNQFSTVPVTRSTIFTTKHSVLTSNSSQGKKPIETSKFQRKKPEILLSKAICAKPISVVTTKKPQPLCSNISERKPISKRQSSNERRPFVNKENKVAIVKNSNYSQNCKLKNNAKISARNKDIPTKLANTISERLKTKSDDSEDKENIIIPVHLSQQKDIVFEPSEFCRNLILNNRELSPGILKTNQGFKLSTSDRPSAYKKFPPVEDPFGEAIKAINKLKAENGSKRETFEGVRVSMFQHLGSSGLTPSISQRYSAYKNYEVSNPYEEAMKAIEKLKAENQLKRQTMEGERTPLAKQKGPTAVSSAIRPSAFKGSQSGTEGISKMFQQRASVILSPYQERLSVYKSSFQDVDPYEEAMKKIKELQLKRSAKKKVTFATNLTEFITTMSIDEVAKKNLQSPSRDARLTDISEKSEQSSNRSSKCDDFCQTPNCNLNVTLSVINSSLEDICEASEPLVTNTALCHSEIPTSEDNAEAKEPLENKQQNKDDHFIRTLESESVSSCSEPKFEAPKLVQTDSSCNGSNHQNLTPKLYTYPNANICQNLTPKFHTPAAGSSINPTLNNFLSDLKLSKARICNAMKKKNVDINVELDFTKCEEEESFTKFIDSVLTNKSKTTEYIAANYTEEELEMPDSNLPNCELKTISNEFSVDQSLGDLKFEESENNDCNVVQSLIFTDESNPDFQNLDQRDSFAKLLDSMPVQREVYNTTVEETDPDVKLTMASVLPVCNGNENFANLFITPEENILTINQDLVDDEFENLLNANSHLKLDGMISIDKLSDDGERDDRDSFTKLLDSVPFCRSTDNYKSKFKTALKNTTNEMQHLAGFSHESNNSANLENSSIVNSNGRIQPDLRDCPNTFNQYRSSPANSMKTYSELSSVLKASTQNAREQLVTPQPVSVNPHSRFMNEISPDFLNGRLSNIASIDTIPIHTPLILKRLSRRENEDLPSSVRARIIFEEEESQMPQMVSRNSVRKITNILPTHQMVFNVLANEEVNFFLKSQPDISLKCRIPNPLAATLEEGGEMHFQPINPMMKHKG